MFKDLIEFLKSKTFLRHFIVYLLLMAVGLWFLLSWLDSYTRHGEYIKVPDFKGVKISELPDFTAKNKVTYLVVDSIFDPKLPPGVVVKQEPEFNAEVKEGREVYLYVSASLPPEIPMPKLVDRSLRQAIAMVTAMGFRLGKIEFVTDECTNCVLEQKVRGRSVKAGKLISKGSEIDLVAGKGTREIKVGMPCLYGLTKNEAVLKLSESSLTVGKTIYDGGGDITKMKIYKQAPLCDSIEDIEIGSAIDIYLSANYNKIPSAHVDTVSNTVTKDEKDFDN